MSKKLVILGSGESGIGSALLAKPMPLSPLPNMTIFFLNFYYLIFNVIILATTSNIVIIQKRNAILFS